MDEDAEDIWNSYIPTIKKQRISSNISSSQLSSKHSVLSENTKINLLSSSQLKQKCLSKYGSFKEVPKAACSMSSSTATNGKCEEPAKVIKEEKHTWKRPLSKNQHAKAKNSPARSTVTKPDENFCPMCQIPFDILKISPELHASRCMGITDDMQECPLGEFCYSETPLHFRKFSHKELAKLRALRCYTDSGKGNSPKTENGKICLPSSSGKKLQTKKREQGKKKSENNVHIRKLFFDHLNGSPASSKSAYADPLPVLCSERERDSMRDENIARLLQRKDSPRKSEFQSDASDQCLFHCEALIEYKCAEDASVNRTDVKVNKVPCKGVACKSPESASPDGNVRASLSVVLSPDKNKEKFNSDDEMNSPVKVNVTCTDTGWQAIEIDARANTMVDSVNVTACECNKNMNVSCSVLELPKDKSASNGREQAKNTLQPKFSLSMCDLKGQSDRNPLPCESTQLSILSYIEPKNEMPPPPFPPSEDSDSLFDCPTKCSSSIASETPDCKDLGKKSGATSPSAKEKWQIVMQRLRQRGYSALSTSSQDSQLTPKSDATSCDAYSDTAKRKSKGCPSYKRIPDSSFVVDAFRYGYIPGITAYFLSHFHSDHYCGLKSTFCRPIYCSSITASLVETELGVKRQFLHILHLEETRKIDGVHVTVLDANHCPGSVMFLFQLSDGRNFLHVGDFRADPVMESYPCFWNLSIDRIYLDTTYCDPKYDFPNQVETVQYTVNLAEEQFQKEPKTLIVCGTYLIGKEKVFLAVANALNSKIWANARKRKIFKCLENQDLLDRLTTHPLEAKVHVLSMMDLQMENLRSYLSKFKGTFTHILALKPTGWELRRGKDLLSIKPYVNGNIQLYGVPYSEHSSFYELKRFIKYLRPKDVIPTVIQWNQGKQVAVHRYIRGFLEDNEETASTRQSSSIQRKISDWFS